jgi:hypothetical protein
VKRVFSSAGLAFVSLALLSTSCVTPPGARSGRDDGGPSPAGAGGGPAGSGGAPAGSGGGPAGSGGGTAGSATGGVTGRGGSGGTPVVVTDPATRAQALAACARTSRRTGLRTPPVPGALEDEVPDRPALRSTRRAGASIASRLRASASATPNARPSRATGSSSRRASRSRRSSTDTSRSTRTTCRCSSRRLGHPRRSPVIRLVAADVELSVLIPTLKTLLAAMHSDLAAGPAPRCPPRCARTSTCF